MLTLATCTQAQVWNAVQVSVRTGDVRGAGTDADISIILMGSKGQSNEIPLESSADNFVRNKVLRGRGGHLVANAVELIHMYRDLLSVLVWMCCNA
jgi:hypothetical protein